MPIKNAIEKLATQGKKHGLPKVIKIDKKLSKRWGTGTCVIPDPKEVDALMKDVPKGKLTTINDIRVKLAQKHKATISCPITTGIFASISAHAAEEMRNSGKNKLPLIGGRLRLVARLIPNIPEEFPIKERFWKKKDIR